MMGHRQWVLSYEARPWTANAQRRQHWAQTSKLIAEWRQAFYGLALEAKVPHLERVAITAVQVCATRRSVPDTGAMFGAVKAAIDGCVDARVLPDDSPDHVSSITFRAPVVAGRDCMVLTIVECAREAVA